MAAAHSFASVSDAAMFSARAPSGSLSHWSGKRFAAPGSREHCGQRRGEERLAYSVSPLAVFYALAVSSAYNP